jgi:hypothetical protein
MHHGVRSKISSFMNWIPDFTLTREHRLDPPTGTAQRQAAAKQLRVKSIGQGAMTIWPPTRFPMGAWPACSKVVGQSCAAVLKAAFEVAPRNPRGTPKARINIRGTSQRKEVSTAELCWLKGAFSVGDIHFNNRIQPSNQSASGISPRASYKGAEHATAPSSPGTAPPPVVPVSHRL